MSTASKLMREVRRAQQFGDRGVFWLVQSREQRIAELEGELTAIRSGSVVVVPTTVSHAEAMHLVAERYLNRGRGQ